MYAASRSALTRTRFYSSSPLSRSCTFAAVVRQLSTSRNTHSQNTGSDSTSTKQTTMPGKQVNGSHTNGNGSSSTARKPEERVLTQETINPAVIEAEYAVRGEIAIRAEELREMCATEEGRKKLGFNDVISCNIGNPQQLEQKPITFFRQVGLPTTSLLATTSYLPIFIFLSNCTRFPVGRLTMRISRSTRERPHQANIPGRCNCTSQDAPR